MANERQIRGLSRTVGTKKAKVKFILFCEGRNTETDYFKAIKNLYRRALIDVETVGVGGDPSKVTERAQEKREEIKQQSGKPESGVLTSSFEAGDKVWVLFDRDKHEHFVEPIKQCQNSGISIAVSNPCFELWLALHICDFDRPISHTDMQKYLEKICPGYDRNKGKTTDFSKLIKDIPEAEKRAGKQFENRRKDSTKIAVPWLAVPCTTVFMLTKAIREAATEAQ